ncbi:MAG: DUF2298 domain-containing protein [Chloroflexota bacterium]
MTMVDNKPISKSKFNQRWVYEFALVLVLIIAAAFRFQGVEWDDGQNLHPDERFLTGVETSLNGVDSFKEYWDTENSSLNPNNHGYGYFVYGTLPMFLVRYVAEWLDQTGWGEIQVIGRQLSAIADLGVVFLVYLTASRAYDRRVGIVAAAFSAFTVLQIQLSHFLAVDTFLTFFSMLAIYFAVCLATETPSPDDKPFKPKYFIWFGAALGMAVASKVNAVPVAVVIAFALAVRYQKLTPEKRYEYTPAAIGYLILAAFASLLTFRIFQPYAFNGPGFFNIGINQDWLGTLKTLLSQTAGDVDWPPSIQWARRPLWFSFQNMVLWGMGIPMALMAWGGFLAAAWQSITGKWSKHLVLFGWTFLYFSWQSMAFNPTMRYQILVYPVLAVFAGWSVIAFWDAARKIEMTSKLRQLFVPAAGVLGAASLILTAVWAFSFVQIYTRPVTRVAASDWIYQNLPGPLTLPVDSGTVIYNQPLPFTYDVYITPESPYLSSFQPKRGGVISEVQVNSIIAAGSQHSFNLWVGEAEEYSLALLSIDQEVDFGGADQSYSLAFIPEQPLVLTPEKSYIFRLSLTPGQSDAILLEGYIRLTIGAGEEIIPLEETPAGLAAPLYQYAFGYTAADIVSVEEVVVNLAPVDAEQPETQTLQLSLSNSPEFSEKLAVSQLSVDLTAGEFQGGRFLLSDQVILDPEQRYYIQIENLTDYGSVTLLGTALAVEGPWDDGLPMRTSGYDGYTGIYQPDLNFDMNADDNAEKLERFLYLLDTSEYYAISSSRQWASTTRIPERFPLNVTFYRNLMGCPADHTIEWCYNVAQPGMFEGSLGFELIEVFQSNPNLGSFEINDQFSEEAFTVYDHPKVLIFQKQDDYSQAQATNILAAVDFDEMIRLTPKQSSEFKSLLLTEQQQSAQQAGGTWSELFDSEAWFNRSGFGAALVWYLALTLLGWAIFPLVHKALPGLPDAGFPLVRTAGMLFLAYLSWIAGSAGLGYSRGVILVIFLALVGLGLWQAYQQRDWLREELRRNWKNYLIAELVFLFAFGLVLLVRFGNPDLWHPYKGGEKPMDFAYFNAVLKSVSFPAYDPWYAGGYINYYYFGFVFVGTLVKLLGIIPAVAYNLVIPTVLAMLVSGAYSVAGNLYTNWQSKHDRVKGPKPWIIGVFAALLAGLLGNLGTVRMILDRLFEPGGVITFSPGDWYWIPSRMIPPGTDVQPITEFPWFTTIYADLHAHFMALPLTVLALSWALSVVLSKAWKGTSRWQVLWSIAFAAVVIGALRPTNTWDLPTYLALGVVAVGYTIWRYLGGSGTRLLEKINSKVEKVSMAAGASALLLVMTFVFYKPFSESYLQPYGKVQLWQGSLTPLSSYFWHWGLFLFVLVFWMAWETRQWMASTPLSHLRKLEKAKPYLIILGLVFLLVLLGLFFRLEVTVQFAALPLALWAAILLLRPGISDAKRFVLFSIGTALFLTVFVEVIVLAGDIGRMNTVFKFYLQAWVLLSVSSAAAIGWTLAEMPAWNWTWKAFWQFGALLLVTAAAMYPVTATTGKIKDRISADAPATLNGMTYMQFAEYPDEGGVVDLAEDYRAIRWMQENVAGTPVIVEANTPLYRWGSRFSIYTGLPAVIGWDWHQTQQRGTSQVSDVHGRQDAVHQFYRSEDRSEVIRFLWEYDVSYVIVGQLERNYYPGPGLDKFEALDGNLWQEVYRDGSTVIYQVIEN